MSIFDSSNNVLITPSFNLQESCRSKDSIFNTIDIGSPIMIKNPDNSQYMTPLFKENFFDEFRTPIEKQHARESISVYSTKEVDEMFEKITGYNVDNYITKSDVLEIINNIEHMTCETQKVVDLNIPKELFK